MQALLNYKGMNSGIILNPRQRLRAKMNTSDRLFIMGEISFKKWKKIQDKAIKQYRKAVK